MTDRTQPGEVQALAHKLAEALAYDDHVIMEVDDSAVAFVVTRAEQVMAPILADTLEQQRQEIARLKAEREAAFIAGRSGTFYFVGQRWEPGPYRKADSLAYAAYLASLDAAQEQSRG